MFNNNNSELSFSMEKDSSLLLFLNIKLNG